VYEVIGPEGQILVLKIARYPAVALLGSSGLPGFMRIFDQRAGITGDYEDFGSSYRDYRVYDDFGPPGT
jgi:hypothetical protein